MVLQRFNIVPAAVVREIKCNAVIFFALKRIVDFQYSVALTSNK